MSDWTELETPGFTRHLIRYRERESYEGAPLAFDLEYWHQGRREWRAVRNVSSRDWFSLGYMAGQKVGAQKELGI